MSWETGNVIVECFRDMDPVHTPRLLVKNHGPFTLGTRSVQSGVENAVCFWNSVAKMAAVANMPSIPSLEMESVAY